MKNYLPYIAIIMALTMILFYTVDYERKIEVLQNELIHQTDSLNSIIDSLKSEIDTLEWDSNFWDFDIKFNGKSILSSIMFVESSYNDLAYNSREDAVGCLQIRQCMVNDIIEYSKDKELITHIKWKTDGIEESLLRCLLYTVITTI